MKTIRMTVKDGRLVSVDPVNLPEGLVRDALVPDDRSAIYGMTEEEQGDSPEEIAKWIADFEAIPPIELTPKGEKWFEEWTAQFRMPSSQAMKKYYT